MTTILFPLRLARVIESTSALDQLRNEGLDIGIRFRSGDACFDFHPRDGERIAAELEKASPTIIRRIEKPWAGRSKVALDDRIALFRSSAGERKKLDPDRDVPDPVEFPPGVCVSSSHSDGGHCNHWREGDGDCCDCAQSNELGDDGKCRHIGTASNAGVETCEHCGGRVP